jgi:hypothetical protein
MARPFGSRGKGVYIHQTGEYFSSIKEASLALGIRQELLSPSAKTPDWLKSLQIEIIPNDIKNSLRCARLKYKYGITLGDYNRMFEEQNGVCAICGKKESSLSNYSDSIKHLSVDHNHMTGEVRGLLCDKCNRMIGYANENIKILNNAIRYLEEN